MNLFQYGNFVLRSGRVSTYKIECDALSSDDWLGIVAMIKEERLLPPFCDAVGVPRGGVPFALALKQLATGNGDHPLLVAEDIVTTGGSMERFRADLMSSSMADIPDGGVIGVVFIARGPCPNWVTPVFQQTPGRK